MPSNSIKAEQAQEHANHIGRVLGLSDDDVRLSGLATYLEKYVMQALGSWQPISSAPLDEIILMFSPQTKFGPLVWIGNATRLGSATHWKPLPSPPSSTEHGGEK